MQAPGSPLLVVVSDNGLQADALPLTAQGIQQFVEFFLGQGVHQHQFIGKRFSFRLCRIRRVCIRVRRFCRSRFRLLFALLRSYFSGLFRTRGGRTSAAAA